jgi:hypothetical protein
MKQLFSSLLMLVALGACRTKEVAPSTDAALVGRWQLTNRQCYCQPGPLPDETIVFDATTGFQLFRDGQLVNQGTYRTSVEPVCPQAPSQPLVTLTSQTSTANGFARGGSYTVQGTTLVIDEGTYCVPDFPVSTYQRVP